MFYPQLNQKKAKSYLVVLVNTGIYGYFFFYSDKLSEPSTALPRLGGPASPWWPALPDLSKRKRLMHHEDKSANNYFFKIN